MTYIPWSSDFVLKTFWWMNVVLGILIQCDTNFDLKYICRSVVVVVCGCFTALQHFSGHLERGQLTYPHCSWASLLGSLPVLSAHSFASNRQLPFFLISGRERMAVEIISWPISTKEYCRTWGSNPRPSTYQADTHLTELLYPLYVGHWPIFHGAVILSYILNNI